MIRKLRISILAVLAAISTTAMADQYSYEFTASAYSAAGTVDLNGINWTMTTNAGYFGYNQNKGQQIGSAKQAASTVTLSTTDIKGVITAVSVTTSGASGIVGTLGVSVGGTAMGTTATLSSSSTEIAFAGNASGEIRLNFAQTSSKAIYIKAVKVIYTPTSSGETTHTPTMVNGIAAFNALADNTETTLYLADEANARVTQTYGKNAYLRDNSGAICFYGFTKTPAMAYNQHVAGYITGRKATVGGMPAFVATDRTNTTLLAIAAPITEENVEPRIITAGELSQHYGDWVTIQDVTMTDSVNGSDASGQLKIVNTFRTRHYFMPQPGGQYHFSGIVNATASDGIRLSPVYNVATTRAGNPTAEMRAEFMPISTTSNIGHAIRANVAQPAVVFDLTGRRITTAHAPRGIYIVNGKKFIK